ncbi:MAG: potassium channel family protein, partial [Candidatus Binatia bacterium]
MFRVPRRMTQASGFWRTVATRFRIPIVLLASATAYGTIGFAAIERWPLMDALYMSVMTLTTVGYREVHPLDTSGRIFAMSLMIIGVVILFVAVGNVAQLVLSGELGEPLR